MGLYKKMEYSLSCPIFWSFSYSILVLEKNVLSGCELLQAIQLTGSRRLGLVVPKPPFCTSWCFPRPQTGSWTQHRKPVVEILFVAPQHNQWLWRGQVHFLLAIIKKGQKGEESRGTLYFFFFNGSIIALQCCVNFCCTRTWISYMYPYVPSLSNLLPTLLHIYFWLKKRKDNI